MPTYPSDTNDTVLYTGEDIFVPKDSSVTVFEDARMFLYGEWYLNGEGLGGDSVYLNAKAFGATGDGVTDDTVALQTFLNAQPKRAHYLPTGTYRVTAPLTIPYVQGFTLIGETKLYSIIEMDANNLPILRTHLTEPWHGHYHFENFRLRYKTPQTTAHTDSIALQLTGTPTMCSFNYCVFRDLKIDNSRVGLGVSRVPGLVQNPWNNVFERLDFGCTSYSLIDLRGAANMGYPVNHFMAITHLGYFEPLKGVGPALDVPSEFIMDSIDIEDWNGPILSSVNEGTSSLRNFHIERHIIPAPGLRLFDLYTGSYTIDQMTIDIETAPSGSTSYILWGDNCEWTVGNFNINTKAGCAGSNLTLMQPGSSGKVHMIGRTTYGGSATWHGLGYYWEGSFARLDTHASSTAWDVPSLAVGEMASSTATLYGARIGDVVAVTMDYQLPAGIQLTGSVYSNDTIAVTMVNHSGSVFDPGNGYIKARFWKDF